MSQPRDIITKVKQEKQVFDIVDEHLTPEAHVNPRATWQQIKNKLLQEDLYQYDDNVTLAKTIFADLLVTVDEEQQKQKVN